MSTVSKLSPYQLWEIDAIEGWLDDMAARGFLLESKKGQAFLFQKCEPQQVRHRVDVRSSQYGDSDVRREEYREFGWEFVTALDALLDIYRASTPDAVELNTDEVLLRQALEKSQRALKWVALGAAAVLLVLLIAMVSITLREGFFRLFLSRSGLSLAVLVLWYIVLTAALAREIRAYCALRRRNLLQRSYHTPEREAQGRRAGRWDFVLRLLIVVLLLAELVIGETSVREAFHFADSPYAPYSVQEFLPEDAMDSEGEYGFRYPRALCDEYFFGQFTAATGGRDYDVIVYETKWSWLARGYAREQARMSDAEILNVANHEGAWFYVGMPLCYRPLSDMPNTQNLILLEGCRVVEISYFEGPADLRAAALAMH